MYLYNITLNIDDDIREEWLAWMKREYIPELFSCGLFSNKSFFQLVNDEKSEGTTYALQLFMVSEADYKKYHEKFYYKHQEVLYKKFPDKFVEFRTLLKIVE
jgi:hypothetical protein